MIDYSELKGLAEACVAAGEYLPGDAWEEDRSYSPAKEAFIAFAPAATPAAVLALIAENERLKTLRSKTERELEQELEVWRHGPSCWSCGDSGDVHHLDGEWRGKCDCLAAQLIDATRERDQLKAKVESLRDAAAVSTMRIKELDLLFGRYLLAMRAAVIEDEHGKTETAGMDWIFNSLAGPGELPPEGETDAQAYFDREIVAVDRGMAEVLAFHDQRRASTAHGGRP